MNRHEDLTKAIISGYKLLPAEQKKAVFWFIKNIEAIEKLLAGEKIPEERLEAFIKCARRKKDYMILTLLLYKRQINQ